MIRLQPPKSSRRLVLSDKLAKAIVHVPGDAQSLLATKRDLRLMELRLFLYVLAANGAGIGFLLKFLS